jgi:hypothetical protein
MLLGELVMPKFRKEIVTAGTYKQWDKEKQQWYNREVSPEFLQKLKSSFDRMTEKGLKVPAPWKHDLNIHAFAKIDGPNPSGGFLEDANQNGGFWENLETEVIKGKTTLVGVIDAPGDVNDPNTPAGKVSKTVRDTSIYVRDKMPITDGSDDYIENALMHIALVTHPIQPGQANFEALEDNASYLAMSQLVEEPGDDADDDLDTGNYNIPKLAEELKKCLKIFIPETTTIKNLIPNLMASIKQYEMLNNDANSTDQIVKVDPIIMNQDQIKSLVDAKVVNPTTGKPYVNEDFKTSSPSNTQNEIIMSAIQTQFQSDRRTTFKSRIDNLINTGRTTKAFADSNLYPKAASYEIKIDAGQVAQSPLEEILMNLEAMEAKVTKAAPVEVVMGGAPSDDTQYTEEETDKMAAYMAGLVN